VCILRRKQLTLLSTLPLLLSLNGDSINKNQDRKRKKFGGEIDEFGWNLLNM
jgi:hypothetical protein